MRLCDVAEKATSQRQTISYDKLKAPPFGGAFFTVPMIY
jgi:hypothetical protein